MRRKFGMPTLVECDGLKECAEAAERLGLDFVEINMSFPQYQAGHLDPREALTLAFEHNIFYTIHADELLNPFDFNPKVAACYTEVMTDTIRMAKAIGAPVINLHLLKGVYVTLPGKVILLTDVYRDAYRKQVEEFVRRCEEEIGSANLRVCIENVDSNPFTGSQLSVLDDFFLKSPVFALTLDVGHEDVLGHRDSPVFEKYPDKIVHMHLHDSDGKHPHLPLGTAGIPVAEKLGQLSPDGTCLIEVKTLAGLETSVSYLKDHSLMK